MGRQQSGGSGRVTPKGTSARPTPTRPARKVNKVALVLVVLILAGLIASVFAGLFGADGVPVGAVIPPTVALG